MKERNERNGVGVVLKRRKVGEGEEKEQDMLVGE